tara:strand:- start:1758 stop:2306 length:549 start_codon:yes stop_codon:yes gene_type:complete
MLDRMAGQGMSQTELILAVASIAAVMLAGYFIYYLASVATDLYQLKVDMKREVQERLSSLKQDVETRIVDRSKWIRENLREENQRSLGELRELVEKAFSESDKEVAQLREQIAELTERLARLEGDAEDGVETPDAEHQIREAPAQIPAAEQDVSLAADKTGASKEPSPAASAEAPVRKINKG